MSQDKATIECPCCGDDISITLTEIMNDSVVKCPGCLLQYQLEFKYYVIEAQDTPGVKED